MRSVGQSGNCRSFLKYDTMCILSNSSVTCWAWIGGECGGLGDWMRCQRSREESDRGSSSGEEEERLWEDPGGLEGRTEGTSFIKCCLVMELRSCGWADYMGEQGSQRRSGTGYREGQREGSRTEVRAGDRSCW